MAKLLKDNDRVRFRPGQQKSFINECVDELNLSNSILAKLLNVSVRTLTDWKREKFLIPKSAAQILSKESGTPLPHNVEIEKQFWHVHKAAKIGGLAVYKKYGHIGGDPQYRMKKWREWWKKEGKFISNPILQQLPIKKPRKSVELAELTGIILGDGGLSENQLTITLNYKDDKDYILFVIKLMEKLFGVSPAVYPKHKSSVDNIVISRRQLVKFLTQRIGLKKGNKIKNRIDIPQWIKNNKKFKIACVRGLIDTDGSVFTHTYKVGGKWYSYKKLDFTSLSQPLLTSVFAILKKLGLHPRIARHKSVRLDSALDMERYFSVVETHNPKHLRRYLK